MNLTAVFLIVCLALTAFVAYKTYTLQNDLREVTARVQNALTAEDLDESVMPLLEEMQSSQAALRRTVSALALTRAQQPPPGRPEETRDVAEEDRYEEEEDEEDYDEDYEGDEGPNFQNLLSTVANVLGSFQPAQHNARVVVSMREKVATSPIIVEAEEVDDAEEADGADGAEEAKR